MEITWKRLQMTLDRIAIEKQGRQRRKELIEQSERAVVRSKALLQRLEERTQAQESSEEPRT